MITLAGRFLVGLLITAGSAAAVHGAEALDQVVVNTLAGPASCYAGTAGADNVVFLRDDLQRTDCSILSGQAPCLARREFVSDGPNGRAVSLEGVIITRPSVTGDGVSVYFTQFGFSVCGMNTAEELNEGCFGRDLIVIDPHTIAPTPRGDQLAIVLLDQNFQPSNQISVGDASTLQLLEAYTVAVPGPGGDQLQVEVMDFSVNGRYLFVDAFNPVTGSWAIYAVERLSGQTLTIIAPVAGLHIRNPALAQTSDDFLTFDVQNTSTFANTVAVANLLTGELTAVAATSVLGFPSFTGDDGAIVFTDVDAGTESGVSLDRRALLADRMAVDPTQPRSRFLTDGGVGVIYRRGVFDDTLTDPSLCGTTPGLLDTDGDGLSDSFELATGLDPNDDADALQDTDADGFSNLAENQAGTNLNNATSAPADGTAVTLAASVLPSSRSVQVNATATAFATVINAGSAPAVSCSLAPREPMPAVFFYRTTDPVTNALTGSANAPVDIAAGATQTFVFGITPRSTIAARDLTIRFACNNTGSVATIGGVNTLQLSAAATPVPDIVALAATPSNDGITVLSANVGVFAVASVNVGAAASITVRADTAAASLPVALLICPTDPMTAQCLSDPAPRIDTAIAADATPTFSIFATSSGVIPLDAANNRVFVRFDDAEGVTRGSTSVAIRTQP